MLAKTLLHLDSITRKLDDQFEPQSVIRDYAEQLMVQKLAQKFDPRNFYPALLDLNQLVLDLPHRAREIIDLTAVGKLTFGLKLMQAEQFLAGIHKIANRITVGVIIAAIIVSSAMMMRTAPSWRQSGTSRRPPSVCTWWFRPSFTTVRIKEKAKIRVADIPGARGSGLRAQGLEAERARILSSPGLVGSPEPQALSPEPRIPPALLVSPEPRALSPQASW